MLCIFCSISPFKIWSKCSCTPSTLRLLSEFCLDLKQNLLQHKRLWLINCTQKRRLPTGVVVSPGRGQLISPHCRQMSDMRLPMKVQWDQVDILIFVKAVKDLSDIFICGDYGPEGRNSVIKAAVKPVATLDDFQQFMCGPCST